ncbi:MAG: MG2 domain-containing protein [Chthoniobacterales bacterium]
MKNIRFALVIAAAAAIFFVPAHASEPDVTMIPESGDLQPSSTLEFRFANTMVKPDELGPAAQSPVIFEPELPGSFTWLSTRSGVFTPQGPLPLGGSWQASLRQGLPGSFSATVTTPPFSVTKVGGNVGENAQVQPNVGVNLAFNLPVALDPSFFKFVSNDGKEIAAKVRVVKADEYFPVEPEAQDWNLRWKLAADPSAESPQETAARIAVTPATPLPVAKAWRLVVKQGLPADDGKTKLPQSLELAVGEVKPFELAETEFRNYVNSGPTATIRFSENLAPDITDETASKFFSVSPEVEKLDWEIVYDAVVLRGPFKLGQEYTLRIGDDVVSGAGQPFSGSREVPLSFQPVPPRLYLPELTMSQILGGRRILPVRTVNLASLRVRAVLLSPDQAARAMSIFEENRWKYSNEEPVPTDKFSGKTVSDETIAVSEALVDKRATTDLDWSRILGDKKAGIVYLEITGDPLAEVGGKKCAAQALVQLTDLGILWTKAGDDLGAYIFSNATGKPVSGASLALQNKEFATFATGQTGENGEAKFSFDQVPAWLVVKSGEDTCALRMGPGAQSLPTGAWFSDWDPGNDNRASLRGSVFTDRPLYQPTETVRIKGYLRDVGEDGVRFAGDREVGVTLYDPEENEIASAVATADAKGAFDSALVLPPGPVGRYRISVAVDENSVTSESILVAEYQPDAFEVELDLSKEFPAGSPAPTARVLGNYFFGGKLTDAEVRWSLRYFQTLFAPDGFGAFQFLVPSFEETEAEGGKALTLRGEGKITGGAPLDISPQLPVPALAPFRGALTAEVTDINQQTVSSTAEFTRESSDFYLGINRGDEQVVALGAEIPLQVIAVQPDGQPVANPVEVKVDIWRWRYNVVRELGAGGAMTFRSDKI